MRVLAGRGTGRKIVIAGSGAFWGEAAVWKARLELDGYEVAAWIVQEDGSQSWRELYEDFYAKMEGADDIFVLNMDKNGVAGYIGYETFAELSKMVLRRKAGRDTRVYLYQWPGEECGCHQEIMAMREAGWVELWEDFDAAGGFGGSGDGEVMVFENEEMVIEVKIRRK